MNRLFGKSKKDPPPNLTDAISRVDNRVTGIEQKIKALDAEIATYKEQLAKLPASSSQRDFVKQRAIRCLQQKKLYEHQVQQMRQQSFNMEQTAFATESLKDTGTTVEAMRTASKDMRRQLRLMDVDKVEGLQEELQELMESSAEIQEVMSRSYAVPEGIDEADLEAELDALQELGELDKGATYLDTLPVPPINTNRPGEEREAEKGDREGDKDPCYTDEQPKTIALPK